MHEHKLRTARGNVPDCCGRIGAGRDQQPSSQN